MVQATYGRVPELLSSRDEASWSIPAHERGRLELQSFSSLLDRHEPNHVYLMSADPLMDSLGTWHRSQLSARLEGRTVEALVLESGAGYPMRSLRGLMRSERGLLAIKRAGWDNVSTLNPLLADRARRRGFGSRVALLPDPAIAGRALSKVEARTRLGIPAEGRYLVLPGIVSHRKSGDLLLRAFSSADLNDDDRLLLIGTIDPPIRDLLSTACARGIAAGRIIAVHGYLGPEEFACAIAAADVVCAVHPRPIQSSGLVVEAAAAGRPVLGESRGWMGSVLSKFRLGWTCDVTDEVALRGWLRRSLELAPEFPGTPQRYAFARYHTAENFILHWTKCLRDRTGRPPRPPAVSWEDTLAAMRLSRRGGSASSLARRVTTRVQ